MKVRSYFMWAGLGLLSSLLAAKPVQAGEVIVFAAASLTDALKEIARTYEKSAPDVVRYNIAASSILERQIEEGAPADLFFSADEIKMDALQEKNLIDRSTRKSRLSNTLVVIASAESGPSIHSTYDLTNAAIKRIVLANPAAVPAGVYAKKYLQKIHLWSLLEPKVVAAENVRGALAAVEAGNAEAGMVYKTDALISKKISVAHEIPSTEGPDISYPLAQLREAKHPAEARKFREFLNGPEADRIFEHFGFIVRK